MNHLVFSIDEKQSFLEMIDSVERVKTLTSKIEKEIEILSSERKIRSNVKKQKLIKWSDLIIQKDSNG